MDSQVMLLDATDLKCPLPVLKARRILRDIPVGSIVEILVTDPGAPKDFQHFCRSSGHEFLSSESDERGICHIRLKKGGG